VSITLISAAQQIKETEVPDNVRATAQKQNDNQPVTMWVLDKNRGKYIASIFSNTEMRIIEVSLDGKWIETTEGILPAKMPATVMNAAKKDFGAYELDNFVYITTPDKEPYYNIDASSDDEDLTLTISPDGKLLMKETR
jgi:hypothetical protein